jgi:hypothetical protein
MIKLGDGWIAEDHRIFHECGPDLRTEMTEPRNICHCGTSVPRRVKHFEEWLAGGRRGLLIDALLNDGIPMEGGDSSDSGSGA